MKKAWAGFSKQGKGISSWLLGFAALIVLATLLHAQTATVSPPPDSIVQATAQAQGLDLIASADLPVGGTFWLVTSNGITAPSPCPPRNLSDFPVYQMADGIYLVDETGGQAMTNEENSTIESALAAQADAVTGLINQIQDVQDAQLDGGLTLGVDRGAGMAMMMSDFSSMMTPTYDTNGLWLEITNVSNGWSYFNLHNSTNIVYAILSTTSLAGGTWNVETELFPTLDQTNVMPFSIQNFDRQNLFLKAMDWTGVDSDGDGIPDWWAWQYWGSTNVTDTNLDYSGNNNTFAQDYSNNIVPTVFSFTGLEVTNNYVNNMSVPVQLAVAGSPYYLAVSVDDTNYATDANWQSYAGTNVTVNLGITEGWHDVWIALRGHGDAADNAVWQWARLKLDFTPPQIVITNPVLSTVDKPIIQLQGLSDEALGGISYDLSNAAGTVTNQSVLVEGQDYSTNTFEFTTNYFQAYDVPLTNGVNTITIHATDLAGNTTTTNISLTVDYSAKTNPPVMQLLWPQDGMEIVGSNIVCRGWVCDDTATVTVQLVDANGNTNMANSLVGRDGNFYSDNLTLAEGTNFLTYTVTDAAGNSATTNLAVSTSDLGLTLDTVVAGQTLVTGTIDDTNYTVYVNGVTATNDGYGNWSATITSIGIGGGAVVVNAVLNGGDPTLQQLVQPPQGVFVSAYHTNNSVIGYGEDNYYTNYNSTHWENGLGGNSLAGMSGNGYILWQDESAWPLNTWPQPLPDGTMEIYGEDGNTNVIGPIGLPEEHCDINEIIDGNGTVDRSTADTEMKLATGGPLGSRQMNLWCISATATDADTGLPIPPEQIKIGGLGNLDTNGNLYVVLPDNDPPVITPMVPDSDNYNFTVGKTEYFPDIYANNTNLSLILDPAGSPTFCVGQRVVFSVNWRPGVPPGLVYQVAYWNLPGTFVNTNPTPNTCGLYYTEDASQLITTSTNGTSSTSCWYVKDFQHQTASVTLYVWLKNGKEVVVQPSGQFNVHRPTTAQATPYQPDGTPTATITNITYNVWMGKTINATKLSLSLGDGKGHNDMSFSHTLNPGNFSGQAGYVQLITSADVQNADPGPAPFNGTALDGAVGEFPADRQTTVPANATTALNKFYDGPAVPLPNSTLQPVWEDVDFSTYLMFRPDPQASSIWVPLRLITWEVHDSADPKWSASISNPYSGATQTTTTDPSGHDNDSTVFPDWTAPY